MFNYSFKSQKFSVTGDHFVVFCNFSDMEVVVRVYVCVWLAGGFIQGFPPYNLLFLFFSNVSSLFSKFPVAHTC